MIDPPVQGRARPIPFPGEPRSSYLPASATVNSYFRSSPPGGALSAGRKAQRLFPPDISSALRGSGLTAKLAEVGVSASIHTQAGSERTWGPDGPAPAASGTGKPAPMQIPAATANIGDAFIPCSFFVVNMRMVLSPCAADYPKNVGCHWAACCPCFTRVPLAGCFLRLLRITLRTSGATGQLAARASRRAPRRMLRAGRSRMADHRVSAMPDRRTALPPE